MKLKLNRNVYLEREFYLGIIGILLGTFLMSAPDRNTGLYLIYPKTTYWAITTIGAVMLVYSLFIKAENNLYKLKVSAYEIAFLFLFLIARPIVGVLGLFVTIFIICITISLMLEKKLSFKTFGKAMIFNIVLIAIMYFVFAVILRISIPNAFLF